MMMCHKELSFLRHIKILEIEGHIIRRMMIMRKIPFKG